MTHDDIPGGGHEDVGGTGVEPGTPPPLTVAASIVAVEGASLLLVGLLDLFSIDETRRAVALSGAVFYLGYGALLVAAARALWQRLVWSRGPAVLTQILVLGIAWSMRDILLVAIGLAAVAAVAIAGILHPDSVRALSPEDGR